MDAHANDDELALARYRYLLRSAPPEAIEQVHLEAFAQLTPAQRAQLLRQICEAPAGDAEPSSEDFDEDDAEAFSVCFGDGGIGV